MGIPPIENQDSAWVEPSEIQNLSTYTVTGRGSGLVALVAATGRAGGGRGCQRQAQRGRPTSRDCPA